MSHLLQQIEFPPENHANAYHPPPIVADDLVVLTHGGGSSSRLPVRRLDAGLAEVRSVHGVKLAFLIVDYHTNLWLIAFLFVATIEL
jgi:hypothetical protein